MNILYIALKHVIWRFRICCEISKFRDFMNRFSSGAFVEHFAKIAHKVAKSKYFVDIQNELDSSINSLSNDI